MPSDIHTILKNLRPLNETNWNRWKRNTQMLLESYDLWYVVDPTLPRDPRDTPVYDPMDEKESVVAHQLRLDKRKAFAIINFGMEEDQQRHLDGVSNDDPRAAWQKLIKVKEDQSAVTLVTLMNKLINL